MERPPVPIVKNSADFATVLNENNAAKRIRVLDRIDNIFFIFPLSLLVNYNK